MYQWRNTAKIYKKIEILSGTKFNDSYEKTMSELLRLFYEKKKKSGEMIREKEKKNGGLDRDY